MIAESITMQAFGPYIQKNTINFKKLNEYGLFVISGNTGSGKTTILDAICVALYGRSTGGERSFKELRNTSASNEIPTIVEYVFSLGEKKYKFVRKIFVTFRKRKKEFELKSEHECFTLKNNIWELLDSSSESSIRAIAEKLLGLDCNQFSKVVMLPQGEFKNLLLSSSTDKSKILSKLFETEKWEKITEKIKLMAEEKGANIKGKLNLKEKILHEHRVVDTDSLETHCKEIFNSLYEEKLLQRGILEEISALNNEINIAKEFNSINETKTVIEKKLYESKKAFDDAEKSLNKINNYGSEIENLKNLEQNLISEIIILEKSYLDIESLFKVKSQKSQLYEILIDKKKSLKTYQKIEKDINEKIKNLKTEISKLETISKSFLELISLSEKYDEIQKLQKELCILDSDYNTQKQKLELKKENINSLKEEFENVEKKFISSTYISIAQKLKIGEPCPICGSTMHPSPATQDCQIDNMLSNENLNQLKSVIQNSEKEFYNQNESLIKKLSKLELKTEELNKKKLALNLHDLQDFNLKSKILKQKLDDAGNATKKLELLKNELNSLEKEQKSADDSLKACLNEISKTEFNLKILCEHENLLYNKISLQSIDKSELETTINLKKEEKTSVKEKIFNLQNSLNELKNNFILAKGAYETTKEEYSNVLDRLKGLLNEAPNIETYSIFDLNQKLNTLQIKNETSLQKIGCLSQKYDYISKDVNYLKKIDATIIENENEYSKIEKLYQLLSGSNQMKTPIKMFVLGMALDNILSRANIYLSNLSHRRYSLSRKTQSTPSKAYTGLDIEVFDAYLGAVRSASTLSGGELFLASLALAFGLSDVIQSHWGKIRIDSLFIDEGFGSLDFDTLNTVIEALNEVKKGGRIIGIISHIEEIKNRINAKIEVKNNKYESLAQVTIG